MVKNDFMWTNAFSEGSPQNLGKFAKNPWGVLNGALPEMGGRTRHDGTTIIAGLKLTFNG